MINEITFAGALRISGRCIGGRWTVKIEDQVYRTGERSLSEAVGLALRQRKQEAHK